VQKDLIAFMRSSGIATVENYKRRMSGHDIHLMLKSKIEALSYVGGVNVLDADGNLINASAAWPVPAINVADRAYFQTFRSSPQSPEMLVEPVHSRITGAWTTVIARKVTGPKGEFLGAIGRGIEPTNFEKFFATVALGPGATIAMHHSDGTLLARYPQAGGLTTLTWFEDHAPFTQNAGAAEFVAAYNERVKAAGLSWPHVDYQAAAEFAAWQILEAAAKGVGRLDDKAMAAWLRANPVDTVLGTRRFDGKFNSGAADTKIKQAQNGKWVTVWPPKFRPSGAAFVAP